MQSEALEMTTCRCGRRISVPEATLSRLTLRAVLCHRCRERRRRPYLGPVPPVPPGVERRAASETMRRRADV